MSTAYRPMRDGQEDAVASFIRKIPAELGLALTPGITGATLKSWTGEVRIMIADNAGLLCGACVWFTTYSTWRAAKGLHISDVFILSHLRGRGLGTNLLKATAREASKQGATFVRIDLATALPRLCQHYQNLGFRATEHDHTLFLESTHFKTFIAEI